MLFRASRSEVIQILASKEKINREFLSLSPTLILVELVHIQVTMLPSQ